MVEGFFVGYLIGTVVNLMIYCVKLCLMLIAGATRLVVRIAWWRPLRLLWSPFAMVGAALGGSLDLAQLLSVVSHGGTLAFHQYAVRAEGVRGVFLLCVAYVCWRGMRDAWGWWRQSDADEFA